jgi:hypothetical protein
MRQQDRQLWGENGSTFARGDIKILLIALAEEKRGVLNQSVPTALEEL